MNTKEHNPNIPFTPEERTCTECGKTFVCPAGKDKTTCSGKCTYHARTGYWVPAQNPEVRAKMRKTTMERYGVENASQLDSVKEQKKATLAKHYGGEECDYEAAKKKVAKLQAEKYLNETGYINPGQNPEVKKKVHNTVAEKYGDGDYHKGRRKIYHAQNTAYKEKTGYDNPGQNPEVRAKVLNTVRTKYGVDNVFQLESVKKKSEQTSIRKYGVKIYTASEEGQRRIAETNIRKYGVPYIPLRADVQEASGTISSINKEWHQNLLDKIGVDFDFEKQIGESNWRADLGYGNMLIDINPTISHNVDLSYLCIRHQCKHTDDGDHIECKGRKDVNYHHEREMIARDYGQELFQVYDWYNQLTVMDTIASEFGHDRVQMDANDLTLKPISMNEADAFNDNYGLHDDNSISPSYSIGLFDNDELIFMQSFSKEDNNWIMLHPVSKFGIDVINGQSRCFDVFNNRKHPTSCTYYLNLDYNSSTSKRTIESLGFKLRYTTGPIPYWSIPKPIHSKAIVYRVGEIAEDKDGTPLDTMDTESMLSHGFVRVYTSGFDVYEWTR